MNSTSEKCIAWAIGLFIIGTLIMIFSPAIITAASSHYGINQPLPTYIISFLTTIVRLGAFPIGAALIGAAVVIQTLLPKVKSEN